MKEILYAAERAFLERYLKERVSATLDDFKTIADLWGNPIPAPGTQAAVAEKDLSQTIEGEFSIPVVLISPQGERIAKTVDGRPLGGRVLWSRKEITSEGMEIIVPAPVVTLRERSLSRIPNTGEKWFVQIPSGPAAGMSMTDYLMDTSSAVEHGQSLGVINIPLVAAIAENGDDSEGV